MPLIVKVGVSRKVSADYQSQGFTLDLQSELDPRTVDDPNALASATGHLFQLANDLLDEQVRQSTGSTKATTSNPPKTYNRSIPAPTYRSNTTPAANSGRQSDRGITQAQTRAIQNMAKRLERDPEVDAHDEFGVMVKDLTIKQASQLIAMLKEQVENQEPVVRR